MPELYLFKKYLFILILAVLGLHHCMWVFSICSKQGLLSSCSAWASHCGSFSGCGTQALGTQTQYCDTESHLPLGMCDPPRPEIKLVSLALQGGLLTSVPPGKPLEAWS